MTTAQAVEKAIRLAQDAVKADESGNIEAAIDLYVQSVELIKLGLQVRTRTHAHAQRQRHARTHRASTFYHSLVRDSMCAHGLRTRVCGR